MHWQLLTESMGKTKTVLTPSGTRGKQKKSCVEENYLQKDSLIFLLGLISQPRNWDVKGATASYHCSELLNKVSLAWGKNQFITLKCDFSFIFCTRSRRGKKGREFCRMSICFLLKWHYVFGALFFITCINCWILTISQTTEFNYNTNTAQALDDNSY